MSPVSVDESLIVKGGKSPSTFVFDLAGMTGRPNSAGGVDLLAGGQKVGTVPTLTVTTARGAVAASVSGAALTVAADGAGRVGGRVTISVSSQWLGGLPASAFPVVIDPTFYGPIYPSNVTSMTEQNPPQTCACLQVGVDSSTSHTWRGAAQFPLPPGVDSTWKLIRATMYLGGSAADGVNVYGWPYSGPPTYVQVNGTSATPLLFTGGNASGPIDQWVSQQGASWYGFASDGHPLDQLSNANILYDYEKTSPPTTLKTPPDQGTVATATPTLVANVVDSDPEVWYDFKVTTGPFGDGPVADSGWLEVRPGGCNGVSPCTTTPTWTVPAGSLVDGMTYYATVQDDVGAPWDPTSVFYVPPATAGQKTTFTVKKRLGAGGPSPTDTVGSTPGGTTTPSQGAPNPGTPPAAVTVNMVTGNLSAGVNTRGLQTVSGTASVALNYNSKAADSLTGGQYGLHAEYHIDNPTHDITTAPLIGQRLDPAVNVLWNAGSPLGAMIDSSSLLARWTGAVTVPTSGPWQFGGITSGGQQVYLTINGTKTLVSGPDSSATPTFGGSQTLSAGVLYPIEVDYWNDTSQAIGQLWEKNPAITDPTKPSSWPVPSQQLAPQSAGLPVGWSLSPDSLRGSWTHLSDQGSQVVLQNGAGETAAFTRQGLARYQAPPGNLDVLSVSQEGGHSGEFQLSTPDNYLYNFKNDGSVSSVTQTTDDLHPAGVVNGYLGSPPHLTSITDPVSNRHITLTYNGIGGSCPGTDPYGNLTKVPPGMLCQIGFWDNTSTVLTYNDQGQLVQVTNPGDSIVGFPTATFSYDTSGRIAEVRDPLANDAIAAGRRSDCLPSATSTPTCDTSISYDSSGRVAVVTQPAPTAGAQRPARVYCYNFTVAVYAANPPCSSPADPATPTTSVGIAGFTPASGRANVVTYDDKSRITKQTDSTGLTTTTVWDDQDRPMVSIDPTGLVTSRLYDINDNQTTVYGPAPTGCFAAIPIRDSANTAVPKTALPASGCSLSKVPETDSGYDENTTSLAATFYSNPHFAGAAVLHSTGPGGTGAGGVAGCTAGTLCTQWNTLPAPIAQATGDGGTCPAAISLPSCPFQWALRLTGTINFPGPNWSLATETTQHTTVFVDGQVAAATDAYGGDSSYGQWVGGYPGGIANPTAGLHHIEIDFYGSTTTLNGFTLQWIIPGTTSGWVPIVKLNPAYGLHTSTTDGETSSASTYSDTNGIAPEYGLPTSTTQDPGSGHLNLTSTVGYEPPGPTTYLRKVSQTLPAQQGVAGASSLYCYWGGSQTPDNNSGSTCPNSTTITNGPCGTTGIPQGGMLEQQTDPAPDSASQPRVQQFVYDRAGRQVGRRVGNLTTITGAGWQCTTYDTRGRIIAQTWLQPNGAAARTMIDCYAVGANPLVTAVTDQPGATCTNPTGTGWITSTVDLLGRLTTYTDAWGQPTTMLYDQANRPYNTNGPQGNQVQGYDPNSSKPTTVTLDGTLMATAAYDPTSGRMSGATYANNSSLANTYDTNTGNQTDMAFTGTGSSDIIADHVVKSTAGRVIQDWVDPGNGVPVNPKAGGGNDFVYDGAGRLTTAYLNGTTGTYNYNPNTAGCAYPNQGANTNRTSVAYTGATTTNYCYNQADQITAIGANTDITYDDHGNTLHLAGTNYTWDAADRNTTITAGGTTVTYLRDALDRVTERDATAPGTPLPISADQQVSFHQTTASPSITSPAFTTTHSNELIVATISTDGPTGSPQTITGVSGDGLTWTRASGANSQTGDAEVWTAYTTTTLSNVAVTATRANGSYRGTISVTTLTGANPTIGAAATAGAATGPPTVALTTSTAGSVIWAAGTDSTTSAALTPNPGQSLPDQFYDTSSGKTYWSQALGPVQTAKTQTTIGDSTPTTGAWNLAAIEITAATSTTTTSTRYAYSGFTDTPSATLDTTNTIQQRYIALPGGVLVTKQASADIWSYPNLHGDVVATAGSNGTRQSGPISYDPWGNQLSATAPIDNSNARAGFDPFGSSGKLQDHNTPNGIIQMGARPYDPVLGRFVAVDPIQGGCSNAYAYVFGDPINANDLSGQGTADCPTHHIVPQNDNGPDPGNYGKAARDLLDSYGINVEDPANKIDISIAGHKFIHSKEFRAVYYKLVYQRLLRASGAGGRAGIVAELKQIGHELANAFPCDKGGGPSLLQLGTQGSIATLEQVLAGL